MLNEFPTLKASGLWLSGRSKQTRVWSKTELSLLAMFESNHRHSYNLTVALLRIQKFRMQFFVAALLRFFVITIIVILMVKKWKLCVSDWFQFTLSPSKSTNPFRINHIQQRTQKLIKDDDQSVSLFSPSLAPKISSEFITIAGINAHLLNEQTDFFLAFASRPPAIN